MASSISSVETAGWWLQDRTALMHIIAERSITTKFISVKDLLFCCMSCHTSELPLRLIFYAPRWQLVPFLLTYRCRKGEKDPFSNSQIRCLYVLFFILLLLLLWHGKFRGPASSQLYISGGVHGKKKLLRSFYSYCL